SERSSGTWSCRSAGVSPASRRGAVVCRRDAGATETRRSEIGAGLAPLPVSRALPYDARKSFEGNQLLAAIGPVRGILDRDVVARLAAGARLEERPRDVHHLRRVAAHIEERRAAAGAEMAYRRRRLVLEARDGGPAFGDAESAA